MAKYRPYSRRVLRQRFRAWLKADARLVAGVGLLVAFVGALEVGLLLGLGSPGPLQWFLLGAISSLLVGGFIAGFWIVFLVYDGSAIHQLRGAWGEENTREELKRARRQDAIWGWVDSVTLARGDIDHLVVTCEGGIIAIDSKWRTKVDPAGRDSMVREARESRRRAEGVVRSVLSRERPGRRADGKALRVRTVVVLWGSAQSTLPKGVEFEGVEFVRGRNLVSWLQTLDGDPVDEAPAEQLLASLAKYRADAWADHVEAKSR